MHKNRQTKILKCNAYIPDEAVECLDPHRLCLKPKGTHKQHARFATDKAADSTPRYHFSLGRDLFDNRKMLKPGYKKLLNFLNPIFKGKLKSPCYTNQGR